VSPAATRTVRGALGRFLAQHDLGPAARIVVAVSGGQDSICLLDALVAAGAAPIVAHVEHGLRGDDSLADAAFVRQVAESHLLPFVARRLDVRAYAQAHRLGLEEAARIARYHALAGVSRVASAVAIATAHTRDDLAETLLINIVRGTGLLGITSIQAFATLRPEDLGPAPADLPGSRGEGSPIVLVRPLLSVSRAETAAYCVELRLVYRLDRTNLDPSILRNRLRLHLLPLLATYNPSIVASLARLAAISADDDAALDRLAEDAWSRVVRVEPRSLSVGWTDWLELGPALQRRLLRLAAPRLGAPTAWSFDSLESARELLGARRPARRLTLAGGIILSTARGGFRLAKATPTGAS
jgi:tRNA(Ile)-lysidine synthetase-like protein